MCVGACICLHISPVFCWWFRSFNFICLSSLLISHLIRSTRLFWLLMFTLLWHMRCSALQLRFIEKACLITGQAPGLTSCVRTALNHKEADSVSARPHCWSGQMPRWQVYLWVSKWFGGMKVKSAELLSRHRKSWVVEGNWDGWCNFLSGYPAPRKLGVAEFICCQRNLLQLWQSSYWDRTAVITSQFCLESMVHTWQAQTGGSGSFNLNFAPPGNRRWHLVWEIGLTWCLA